MTGAFRQHFIHGRTVDEDTGLLRDAPEYAVNAEPIHVSAGTRIKAIDDSAFRIFFYAEKIPEELIYTYTYEPESNWTAYCAHVSEHEMAGGEHIVPAAGYIRTVIHDTGSAGIWQDYFDVSGNKLPELMIPDQTALTARVRKYTEPDDLKLILLADTHYTVNGNWEKTAVSVREVQSDCPADAVVHLGDFTDGMLTSEQTKEYAGRVIKDLKDTGLPLYACLGNHDVNYFRDNRERISMRECAAFYLGRQSCSYSVIYPEHHLKLIFINSFDPDRSERYGFSFRDVLWLQKEVHSTPKNMKLIVFSHVPPLPQIHVWSDTILNSSHVMHILEARQQRIPGSILAWIHGHNHADQIVTEHSFPIVGIGCAKLEYFTDHKPTGASVYMRRQDTESELLWDYVLINAEKQRIRFLRCGAGTDRTIEKGAAV